MLGLGSRTTSYYYKELNRIFKDNRDSKLNVPIKLLETNFEEINHHLPDNFNALTPVITKHLKELNQWHPEVILLPNITLHRMVDELPFEFTQQLPIAHPVALTFQKIQKDGFNKAVILGTKYTMNSDFFKPHAERNQIEVIHPAAQEIRSIDAIRTAIYNGTETQTNIEHILEIIKKYQQEIPVIIACTELSLVQRIHKKNVYDMSEIQINHAISKVI